MEQETNTIEALKQNINICLIFYEKYIVDKNGNYVNYNRVPENKCC